MPAKKPALQRKFRVLNKNPLVGGSAQATPAPIVYLPLAHAAHCVSELTSNPALHMKLMLLGANPFAGASIHADQPIIGLYLPIVQSIHAPLVNVVPATHGDTQVFDTELV